MSELATKENVTAALAKVKKQNSLAGMNSREVSSVLISMKPQIEMAIPKHLSADRMIAMATTLITKNPAIAKCSAPSLIGAVLQASILGFRPVDSLGQCYFVPYGGNVQFQIGYKGYIDLARRSGQITDLYAECVYKNDEFKYTLGLDRTIVHVPADGERGEMTHVYAVARYKDGGYNFVVLTKRDVEKLRMRSPMQQATPSGAWKTDYEEMAKAKAVKRLAKYMPMSDEFVTAVETDDKVVTDRALSTDKSGILLEEMDNIPMAEEVPNSVDTTTGEVKEEPSAETAKAESKTKAVKTTPQNQETMF